MVTAIHRFDCSCIFAGDLHLLYLMRSNMMNIVKCEHIFELHISICRHVPWLYSLFSTVVC